MSIVTVGVEIIQGRMTCAVGFVSVGRTVRHWSIEGFVNVLGKGLGFQHSR